MSTRSPEISQLTLPDATRLRMLRWTSHKPTKAALVIQHGIGEHGGRYQTFADELSEVPLDIISFDSRGHGKSDGPRGHADRGLATLADDLADVLTHVRGTGVERVILMGHSMGAAVVLTYATTRTPHEAINGFIAAAPPVRVPRNLVIDIKLKIGAVLGSVVPRLTLPTGLDSSGISSDPGEVARYKNDPLVHDLASAALGVSLVRDSALLPKVASRVTLPILMLHGDKDPIVDIAGTRELLPALGSANKVFHEIPGGYHESHHEVPERRKIYFDHVRAWLKNHLASA